MEKKEENIIQNINKLSMPATILIGCLILGGFYYFTQISKQKSIEKQQQIELQAKKDKEDSLALSRMICAGQAETSAQKQYKDTCIYDCKEGYYYTANYDNYYKSCLKSQGISDY